MGVLLDEESDLSDAFVAGLQSVCDDPVEVISYRLSESRSASSLLEEMSRKNEVLAVADLTRNGMPNGDFFRIPIITLNGTDGQWLFSLVPDEEHLNGELYRTVFSADPVQQIDDVLFSDAAVRDVVIRAGVCYEDSTESREKASGFAEKLMEEGVDLEFFCPFARGSMLTELRSTVAEGIADIHLLVCVLDENNNQDQLESLRSLTLNRIVSPVILLIGTEQNMPGLFIVRDSAFEEDAAFMAGVLLGDALQALPQAETVDTYARLQAEFSPEILRDRSLSTLRENIRRSLDETASPVPVSFELLTVNNEGVSRPAVPAEIIAELAERIAIEISAADVADNLSAY